MKKGMNSPLVFTCLVLALSWGLSAMNSPYVSGDAFAQLASQVMDNIGTQWFLTHQVNQIDPERVQKGDVIFVRVELLDTFFTHYHPKIQQNYVLITHNSDYPAPGKFASMLNDPKIIAWFGQNPDGVRHPKFHPIPIGLANHRYKHGNTELVQRYQTLGKSSRRTMLLYLNFDKKTFSAERSLVYNMFARQKYCKKAGRRPYEQYLKDLTQAKFVMSPRGNGLDCHRTWEAILMGAIPIVKSSPLDPLLAGLPVLIVSDWRRINKKFLEHKYQEIKSRSYDLRPLYIDYWAHEIARASRE